MSADRNLYHFDDIYMLDWSAAGKPTLGKDSIWLMGTGMTAPMNIATRAEAWEWLSQLVAGSQANGRRVLVGFDFAFAYPIGTARALGQKASSECEQPPWSFTWALIESLIQDAPDNANNRFQVGAELNKRIAENQGCSCGPFWGHPPSARYAGVERWLSAKKPPAEHGLPEWRAVEKHPDIKGCQPGWKLCYAGSVGGQALVGIAGLQRLRDQGVKFSVWPFERLDQPVTVAEIYPSLWPIETSTYAIKDANQVAEVITRLSGHQQRHGSLVSLMDQRKLSAQAKNEEGWVLGVPPTRQPST